MQRVTPTEPFNPDPDARYRRTLAEAFPCDARQAVAFFDVSRPPRYGRWLALVLGLLVALAMAGCSPAEAQEPQPTAQEQRIARGAARACEGLTPKEHPHAQVLRWIADGEDVQARKSDGSERWWIILNNASNNWLAALLQGRLHDEYEFRIKPMTITIGDREIEAPIKSGSGYFITDIGTELPWFGDHRDRNSFFDMQKNGRVFATP
ncbi:hypothetical protein BFJ72_g15285, partial [Fusarium proliferatum]